MISTLPCNQLDGISEYLAMHGMIHSHLDHVSDRHAATSATSRLGSLRI
jgi:hypothetical protein